MAEEKDCPIWLQGGSFASERPVEEPELSLSPTAFAPPTTLTSSRSRSRKLGFEDSDPKISSEANEEGVLPPWPRPTSHKTTTKAQGPPPVSRAKSALEESWDSLKFFAMHQFGRLNRGESVEGSGGEGFHSLPACQEEDQHQHQHQQQHQQHDVEDDDDSSPDRPKAPAPSPLPAAAAADTSVYTSTQHQEEPDHLPQDFTSSVEASGVGGAEVFGDSSFMIPELPRGRELRLNLRSTWGVGHYIGLTGIEVLDEQARLVTLDDPVKQITANPSSVNALPQFQGMHDPRTVDKLVDGCNRTTDDLHMWLAPFTPGNNHTVTIRFNSATTISAIRIWNYNKSRIHASRGAKYVEITLDSQAIFKGEISAAPGVVVGSEERCEVILYTSNDLLLEAVDRWFAEKDGADEQEEAEAEMMRLSVCNLSHRPGTSHGRPPASEGVGGSEEGGGGAPVESPLLAAERSQRSSSARPPKHPVGRRAAPQGGRLVLEVTSAWDQGVTQCGLTGLSLTSTDAEPLLPGRDFTIGLELPSGLPIIDIGGGEADPRHSITGGAVEALTARLVSGQNLSTHPEDMVLLPCDPASGAPARIVLNLSGGVQVGELRLWNYNEGVEGTWSGVKRMSVSLNGEVVLPSLLLRKAPGTHCFDFGQTVTLNQQEGDVVCPRPASSYPRIISTPNPRGFIPPPVGSLGPALAPTPEDSDICLTPLLPSGFIFKLVILETHGCPYYVGLNGLCLLDQDHSPLPLTPDNVAACPSSINVLREVKAAGGDPRTVDKILDGVNATWDDRHMWLTPFSPQDQVAVYCFFDRPVSLSVVQLWNYSKTPERGVGECAMYLDDVEIFRGAIKRAPELPSRTDFCQSVLFTNDPEIIARENRRIHRPGECKLDMFNDNMQIKPETHEGKIQRPGTSVIPINPHA